MTDTASPKPPAKDPRTGQLIGLIIAIFVGYYLLSDLERFSNILLVLVGFGVVIFVHELGHFIAAKSVGIKVEAFSLGFGPVVLGIRRVADGFLVRILPTLVPGDDDNGKWALRIPKRGAAEGETEYRISLIPLGGFVKMLGQEDVAADKVSDDPRAYPNKPVWQRAIVIAAGVTMNVIFGGLVFVLAFAVGVPLPPAVVGDVVHGMPADQAGLRPGDEIIAIGGKSRNIAFKDIMLAAIFADAGEAIPMTVRHIDGTVQDYEVAPQRSEHDGMQAFGIMPATELTVARVREEAVLQALDRLGIQAEDKIVAVNGRPVEAPHEYQRLVSFRRNEPAPDTLAITFSRSVESPDQVSTAHETFTVEVPNTFVLLGPQPGYLLGMGPRLQIQDVMPDSPAAAAGVLPGDVVLRFGAVHHPRINELQNICRERQGEPVIMVVERMIDNETVTATLQVTPRRPEPRNLWQRLRNLEQPPIIGVTIQYDHHSAVVARVADDEDGDAVIDVPAGARITGVEETAVGSFQELARILHDYRGQTVQLQYEQPEGASVRVALEVPAEKNAFGFIYVPNFGDLIGLPLKPLERPYRGASLSECLRLGVQTTYGWLAQNYMFIRGLFTRQVSPSAASGPVGILRMSYTIASEKSLIFYAYFMAIISIALAVFNFLPIPILDGGHFVMLIIEKIKGSPVPVRIQEIVTYIGLALILSFALYVTVHDVLKVIKGQL